MRKGLYLSCLGGVGWASLPFPVGFDREAGPFKVWRVLWAFSTLMYFSARPGSSLYSLGGFFTMDWKKAPPLKPCEMTAIITSRVTAGTSRASLVNLWIYPLRDLACSYFMLNKLKVVNLYLLQLAKYCRKAPHRSSNEVRELGYRDWNHFCANPTIVVTNTRYLMRSEYWYKRAAF